MEVKQNRVLWVDTLKCIGIFTIYLGHFLDGAGFAYKFICMYAIQLFFFVSGFFALRHTGETTVWGTIKSKIKHILVPYITFSVLNLAAIAIHDNLDIMNILPMIKQAVFGIRNQLYAPALWFLPCLFVVSIVFDLVYRIGKKGWIVMTFSVIVYCMAANLLPFDATETPRWFFNIDSALFYLFYYALGAVVYPFLKDFRFQKIKNLDGFKKRIAFAATGVLGIIIFIAALLTYFGRKDYLYIYPIFAKISYFAWLYPIFIAMSIIAVHILLAQKLQHIVMFRKMGKNTLLLCGNESLVKLLIPSTAAILGLNIQLTNPLSAYIYAFILLIIVNYVMIPIEKKIIPKFLG